MSGLLRKPVTWIGLSVIVTVVAAVGLYLFQPWRLFTNTTVDEAAPAPVASNEGGGSGGGGGQGQDAGPRTLASGKLITHEHETSGSVKVLRLADGSRVLRIQDLDTSDGPDLRVWLSDQPVKKGTDGWRVFDDGEHEDLGALKGNKGNQNYEIPDGTDLDELTSMSIWCRRFSVSFGAADLQRQ